jgi:hypothetical protein
VPYELGDGAGSALYPSTMFRIGNVDAERALAAIGEFKAIDALMEQAADRYRFPRRGAILRPQRNPREWRANVTQLANDRGQRGRRHRRAQLSAAEVEGRRQIVEYMRFLRAEVPGFEPPRSLTSRRRSACARRGASSAPTAERRRRARQRALRRRHRPQRWPVEMHLAGRIEWGFARDADNAFNQLPWRMLVPQGVANLLVAGRCASMEHLGQSAARASGGCFVMGQAAGTAAALRVAGRFSVAALQAALRDAGADLG